MTIRSILENNYRRTMPAEQQQLEAREAKKQYSNPRSKDNLDQITNLLEVLGPFMRNGIIDQKMVQQAIINPTRSSINNLLNYINKLTNTTQEPTDG